MCANLPSSLHGLKLTIIRLQIQHAITETQARIAKHKQSFDAGSNCITEEGSSKCTLCKLFSIQPQI